jgi:hypothetical protein
MPRSARKRSSKSATAPHPHLDNARLLDAAESVGEGFAEATEHVVRQRGFAELVLGPLKDIPPAELAPGAIGWRREVSRTRAVRGFTSPVGTPSAELACIVVPSAPGGAGDAAPLRDPRPTDRILRTKGPAWPHRVLSIRPGGGIPPALLERFAAAVLEEIGDDEGAVPSDR